MAKPIIILNFKTYEQGTGEQALALAKECEAVAKEHDADIRLAVQTADIYRISQAVSLPVYAQHCDPQGFGTHTGWDTVQAAIAAGAMGLFINHSEHPLTEEQISTMLDLGKDIETIVFADTVESLKKYEHLKPSYFCIEPPELISSADTSISKARPDLISEAVQSTNTPLLVGAGVKHNDDLNVQETQGAHGVILASHIFRAENHSEALKTLLIQQ